MNMKKFSWKKVLACATTFTLCTSMFLGVTASANVVNDKGDVNGDGTVNVLDLMEVSKYVINITDTINTEQADVNSDGSINIFDVMLIATFIVNPETPENPETDTTKITLADTGITIDGTGAESNGSTVTITSAGNYTITGTLSDGQICVDTADTGTVNITLSDVTVTNTTTSPFYVKSATGGTVITLADGTTNTLTDPTIYVYADETTTEPDATLFCENNLTIRGTGSLVINANYGDGIGCKDSLTIENGTFDITSLDDAIRGKDYVEIKGGSVKTNAEGDGVKSTAGYVNISGGTHKIESSADGLQAELESTISGGSTQIYSAKGIFVTAGYNVTGGTLIATAHKNEVATPANSTANVVTMNFAEQQVKKTTVTIGEFSFKPSKKYQYTIVCSADLADGTYKADLDGVALKHDGSETGEFTVAGNTTFTGIQAIDSSQQPTTTENVITLNGSSMTFEGTGATVDGNIVTITEPGDYTVKGESTDGKIVVNVDKTTYVDGKVKLLLNGVTMTNSSDSPIYVESIDDKVIIETASGTVNTISDGTDYTNADEDAGAIYSKDDLNFKGDGTLIVNGNKLDAIVSKNDIKFKSGTYQITSVDDGIRGKDSVTIEAGDFTVKAGGDGIKSTDTAYSTGTDTSKLTGYITILDGTFDIDATYDGIQAETNITINGGTFDIYTSTGAGTASSGGGNQGGGGFGGGGGWNQGGNWGQDTDTTTDSAKALKAGSQVNITGGNFTIDSTDDAVHSNDTVIIDGGTFGIKTGDDGIHADKNTTVNGGDIKIQQCYEGLEGLAVNVTGGNISIVASDDAINAAGGTDNSGNNNPGGWNQGGMGSSGGELNISGGYIWFKSGGDGLDSNGSITLSGGTVVDNGPTSNGDSPVDADGTVTYSGTRIMALGSTGMMSEGYGSSGTYVASTGLNASEGTLVVVTDSDNNVLGAYTTTQQSAGIIFSSPEIVNGATAKIYTGGTLTGATAVGEDGFYTGGTYSGGTEVSTSSSGGNQGGPGGWGGF